MKVVRLCAAVGLYSFLALGFAGQAFLGEARAGETLYAIGSGDDDGLSDLYRIDDPLGSPSAAVIGDSGFGLFDMAISPITGKGYGIAGSTLFGLDLATGQASIIGQGGEASQNALEFTPDGTLYSWGFEDSRLFRVDPATGDAIPVFDLQALSGGDLAAVSDTVLYGTTGTALIEIDIAAQTRTLIGAHGGALEGHLLYGLELGEGGELLGLIGTPGGPTRLFNIDRQTGEAFLIGDIAGAAELGGYGLAYAIPAPGAAALLALAALARRRR